MILINVNVPLNVNVPHIGETMWGTLFLRVI